MVRAGRHNDKYLAKNAEKPVYLCEINGEPVIVKRKEVAGYVQHPVFVYMMYIHRMTKLWGLPNGRGWANEPSSIIEGITAIEEESLAMDNEELNNVRSQSGT